MVIQCVIWWSEIVSIWYLTVLFTVSSMIPAFAFGISSINIIWKNSVCKRCLSVFGRANAWCIAYNNSQQCQTVFRFFFVKWSAAAAHHHKANYYYVQFFACQKKFEFRLKYIIENGTNRKIYWTLFGNGTASINKYSLVAILRKHRCTHRIPIVLDCFLHVRSFLFMFQIAVQFFFLKNLSKRCVVSGIKVVTKYYTCLSWWRGIQEKPRNQETEQNEITKKKTPNRWHRDASSCRLDYSYDRIGHWHRRVAHNSKEIFKFFDPYVRSCIKHHIINVETDREPAWSVWLQSARSDAYVRCYRPSVTKDFAFSRSPLTLEWSTRYRRDKRTLPTATRNIAPSGMEWNMLHTRTLPPSSDMVCV